MSVHAHDLEESVLFYRSLFGMQEIPAPQFPFPVRWLRVGDLELHLFESDAAAPAGRHFGLDVDDFEAVYEKARELGAQVAEGYFSGLYELPDGAVQLYLRDPAGNLVEVNMATAFVERGRTLLAGCDEQGVALSWVSAVEEEGRGTGFSVMGLPVKDVHRCLRDFEKDYEHVKMAMPPGTIR